LTKTLSRLD